MTTKTPANPPEAAAYERFLDTCLNTPGCPNRRWNLLARQQQLPA